VAAKQARAREVQSQIESLDNKVEIAAEAYNKASDHYAKVSAQVARSDKKLQQLRVHIRGLQLALNTRANRMYRTGPLGFLEVLLEAKDFEDFSTDWDVLTDISSSDAVNVANLKTSRKLAEATYKELKSAQAEAAATKKSVGDRKAAVRAQLAQRKAAYSSIQSDIRSIIAAQRAAADAASSAGLSKVHYSSGGKTWAPVSPPPSNSSRGQKVVYWAMSQRGKPYAWGADGPNSYDCSGLTMWAYGKVGVGLPHNASAQAGSVRHVSRANLEPGDLVFFGSSIHHVGIYIGGGQYVHAPSTGDVVKVSSLDSRSDFAGGGRP
jgi:peptidoglycan DL-endopeptidase CwlO